MKYKVCPWVFCKSRNMREENVLKLDFIHPPILIFLVLTPFIVHSLKNFRSDAIMSYF